MAMYSASCLQFITIKPCYHGNLNLQSFELLQSLYSLAPLSPTETAFNSFMYFFPDFWFTPQLFVLPSSLYSYSPFTFSKVQLHSPYPIIKTIFPFRSGLLFPPWDEEPAFHRKVLSLPWIRSINSIYLACSFHCSLTNGNVLLEGVHLTFHTKGVRGVSATPLALLWSFFSGYGWIIDHISLKEWQLTDQ